MDDKLNLNWYVVKTRPLQEEKALKNLVMQGIEVYLPRIKKIILRNGKRKDLAKPLFPGYLFARFCVETHFRKVHYTRGVSRVVCFNGIPIPLDEEEIEFIRTKEVDGFVSIKEKDFSKGEKVKVVNGPFCGFEGLFERELEDGERVEILLKFLSRKAKIIIEKDWVEKTK